MKLILVFFGIFMLVKAATNFFDILQIQSYSTTAVGTVVKLEKRWYSGGSYVPSGYGFVPFVRFRTMVGDIVEFEVHPKRPPEFQPNESVTVRYNPANPKDAVIGSEHQRTYNLW